MRTYRVGASLGPLIGWNLIASLIVFGLLSSAADIRSHGDRWTLYGTAGVLLLMGPVALLAYLIRYWTVRIDLNSEGLILSKRHLVEWDEIRGVELRGSRPGVWNPMLSGFGERFGCWSILIIKVVIVIVFVILVAWLLRSVLFPVLVLYSPWQSRVVIELRDGTRLVYRDLEDADLFVDEVRRRLPGQSP